MMAARGPQNANSAPVRIAAIYCRVSTKEQVLGYSLNEQYKACKGHLGQLNIKRHRIYRDEGKSGKNLKRDALQQMLDDIIEGRITDIIVWKLDRLSRSMVDTLNLIQDLKEIGVSVISVTQQIDTSNTQGMLFVSMLAGFSQMEVENISQRVQMGLKARKREGKWSGTPPYGYKYNPETAHLEPHPAEIPVLKEIYSMYLEDGTLHSIARQLNLKEIPTRNGNPWNYTTIGRILERPLYKGDNNVPALITEQAWEKAQERRGGRKKYCPRYAVEVSTGSEEVLV
ncbi:MAG: recombinase family protein [Thermoplasmata archaeon]|nr:recombinase family protein [Thermoplasmata archaeon]